MTEKIHKTDAEWKAQLTPEQFKVARKRGTERAYSGEYWDNHAQGMYRSVCCGMQLFKSDTKFESGTGWPSFYAPASPENVREESDNTLFMRRTEVLCAACDAHLGHVFKDGPEPWYANSPAQPRATQMPLPSHPQVRPWTHAAFDVCETICALLMRPVGQYCRW